MLVALPAGPLPAELSGAWELLIGGAAGGWIGPLSLVGQRGLVRGGSNPARCHQLPGTEPCSRRCRSLTGFSSLDAPAESTHADRWAEQSRLAEDGAGPLVLEAVHSPHGTGKCLKRRRQGQGATPSCVALPPLSQGSCRWDRRRPRRIDSRDGSGLRQRCLTGELWPEEVCIVQARQPEWRPETLTPPQARRQRLLPEEADLR